MSERSPEDLQRYLAGKLEGDERIAFERDLLASDEAALEAYDELAVREALSQARRARSERHRPHTRGIFPARWAVPSAVAAVLVVMAVVWQTNQPEGPPVFRGVAPLSPVAPVGDLPAVPERFTWSADAGATRYRFELFDATSLPVASEVVADTFVVIGVDAPRRGYWTVTSLDELDLATHTSRPVWYDVVDR
jgi:hypothetical protein